MKKIVFILFSFFLFSSLAITASAEEESPWLKEAAEPENYDYSIAVVGDTQTLSYYYPEKMAAMYDWIAANAELKKMKFVIGLGDITEKSKDSEFVFAKEQIKKLNGIVPYSLVRGNHDKVESYKKHITKEELGGSISGCYANAMLNTYSIFSVGDVKYMILSLDLLATDGMLNWANEVIEDNPDCRVIVTTHIYMYNGGDYYDLTAIKQKYGCFNNGEGIWEKLLSKHENIIMLLCGHNPSDDLFVKTQVGVNGNTVTSMLIDPQGTDKKWEGTGLVAMLYFSENGEKVDVRYYSTARDEYFLASNQFTLTLDLPEPVIKEEPPASDAVATIPSNSSQSKEENTSSPWIGIAVAAGAVILIAAAIFFLRKKK